MTATRTERIHALFAEALAHAPAARAAYIENACPDDPALREEVAALLASADAAPAEFLVPPPAPPAPPASLLESAVDDAARAAAAVPGETSSAADPLAEQLVGRQIGAYEIVRLIAAGGMGIVFEAVQAQPRRTVALKVIRPQYAGTSAVRRFRLEAELLGRLRHPGIAQVYEFGEADTPLGRTPFFAMEYVPGALSLTRYAEVAGLATRERLELFVQVCDAVQHGHMNGVIHRDLKPGNILVGQERHAGTEARRHEGANAAQNPDRKGVGLPSSLRASVPPCLRASESPPLRASVPPCLRAFPKIIDFGVARVDGGETGLTTAHTMTGQIIGTVQYMSPEQCDGDPNAVDVRSDVYSLGVILYELLTGTLPYHATSLSLVAATRAIREQEPARPSTINRKLRGDVETVVLKALEKDREKRYQSADALARDIRHVLTREPIEARTATLLTRAVKWAVRHPVVVTAVACAFILAMTVATVGLAYWYALKRPDYARVEDDSSDAVLYTAAGMELHRWRGGASNAVMFAQYLRGGTSGQQRSLALVGLATTATGDYRSGLYMFDCDRSRTTPDWTGKVTPDEVPGVLAENNTITPNYFDARAMALGDVFDPPTGDEIIVAHQEALRTQTSIRIYSFEGDVIGEVWADFQVQDARWLDEAGLLVVAGFDARVLWIERCVSGLREPSQHPLVVLALRPVPTRLRRYVAENHPVEALRPVWIRCLLPPHNAELLTFGSADSPLVSELAAPQSHFAVTVVATSGSKCGVGWTFDKDGPRANPPRVSGDYSRRMSLPRDDADWLPTPGRDFYWGELPPIILDPNRPDDPNDPTSEDLRRHFQR